jgi:phenylpropionate dioxygenase-like ring-hydroxylating dioxygenase large terminal subunit/AcrR family transcriptional regulator
MSAAHPAEPPRDATGPEPLDARRRRELIEATIESIARHGLSRTTIARVAETAGLSPGIVSFYFKNKDGLLLATLAHVDGAFVRRQDAGLAQAGGDPVRQLEAMIEASFDPTVCNPERIAVWTAFWGEARARDDYMRVCPGREAEDARRVVDLFERIARAGVHRRLDTNALGRAFYQLLSSLPEDMLDPNEGFDLEAAKATCRGFLASVFPDEFAARAPSQAPVRPTAPEVETPLPAWAYHDTAFHEVERRRLFMRHWLLVGHASEIPEPGDYLTLEMADERGFVIRGEDGSLRGFHNLCPHRASPLVGGAHGHCDREIVCPFHGWRYGLDGAPQSSPRAAPPPGDPPLRLPELALSEWGGLVFLRFEGAGPSVGELLGVFAEEVRPYDLERMTATGHRWTHTVESNWKIPVENAAEASFVPHAHPALQSLLGPDLDASGDGDVGRAIGALREELSPFWSARLYQRWLPSAADRKSALPREWLQLSLFPGTVLSFRPDQVVATQVLPLGPDRCRIHGVSVASEDASREMRAARYLSHRITRQQAAEDRRLCREAQAGTRSSRFRALPPSELESGRRRFHERIAALLPMTRQDVPESETSIPRANEGSAAAG